MADEPRYRQVRMRRDDGAVDTAWIPSGFARAGRSIQIRVDGEWQRGWRVEEAYEGTKTAEEAEHRADRKAFRYVLGNDGWDTPPTIV